jgi:hypothetical protein
MMGSGVRIPLAAPIQVLAAKISKLVAMTSFSAPRGQPKSRRDEGAPLSGRPPRQSGRLHARDDVTIAFQRRTWVNNRYRSRPVGRQTNMSWLSGASSSVRFLGRRSAHWPFVAAVRQCVAILSGKLNPT